MRLAASTILRRSLAAWMAFSLGIVCLPSAALCIGDDGHLAIEAVGSSCGGAGAGHAAGPKRGIEGRLASTHAEGSLHGCVDTPLGARGLRETHDAALEPRMAAARVFGRAPEPLRLGDPVAFGRPPGRHLHPLALSPVLIV